MRLLILNMIGRENLMNKWKCDKCGSEDIKQELAFLTDMNDENIDPHEVAQAHKTDFYFCVDCEEECSPYRDKE